MNNFDFFNEKLVQVPENFYICTLIRKKQQS
jgi:hypothetical protein